MRQVDIKGFENYQITDDGRKYNVVMQAISNCCRHKSKTSCGYVWKYKNDQPN